MKTFYIKLADTIIGVTPLYEAAEVFCKDYLVEGITAEFSVFIRQEDIDFERSHGINIKATDGSIPEDYPDSYLEILAIYRKICEQLLDKDVLLIHGSAISYKGRGLLFIADSGVGKSTHSSHWLEAYGEDVRLINDDKPLIKVSDAGPIIYGSPWSGKCGLNTNTKVPLDMIYELSRGDKNETFSMNKEEIWTILMKQTYKSKNKNRILRSLSLLDKLISQVRIKSLKCTDSFDAARVALKSFLEG